MHRIEFLSYISLDIHRVDYICLLDIRVAYLSYEIERHFFSTELCQLEAIRPLVKFNIN